MWSSNSDVPDAQYFKLSDADLEWKRLIHQTEVTNLTQSLKSNTKELNLINYEISMRQALRGLPIEDVRDKCGTCGRSIQFEHPHDSDGDISMFGIRCPTLSVTEHIKNTLHLFGDKEPYTTARLISVLTDLCDMTLYTVDNFVTIMENLKENKVIKFQNERWVLA